jgi:hypothetical protein
VRRRPVALLNVNRNEQIKGKAVFKKVSIVHAAERVV